MDELGLCLGAARIDIAVVNGSLNGFEIKSERDTLHRLPGQQEVYSRSLNQITVVAGGSHIDAIVSSVPEWWGVERAALTDAGVAFHPVRRPRENPHIDPLAVAQLLWRDEALAVLNELGLGKGMLSKPRRALWAKLAEHLSIGDLCSVVRLKLKARENWRADRSPTSGDG